MVEENLAWSETLEVTHTELSYSRLVLQQVQIAAASYRVDLYINYGAGMLKSGSLWGACMVSKRLVENAIDAFVFKAGILDWSDDTCHKWRFDKLCRIVGEDSPIYKEAERLSSFPADLDEETARSYFEECLKFALERIDIRNLGFPGGQAGTRGGLSPRYEFVREWGPRLIGLGMTSAFLPFSFNAIINGGRGPLQPPIDDL